MPTALELQRGQADYPAYTFGFPTIAGRRPVLLNLVGKEEVAASFSRMLRPGNLEPGDGRQQDELPST